MIYLYTVPHHVVYVYVHLVCTYYTCTVVVRTCAQYLHVDVHVCVLYIHTYMYFVHLIVGVL